ncbi:MAG TPA: sarcosine oxidase subunit gamma family protein, partial [Woeseiaceae bacterium]|nr:sarcosine oxidase subunit gamma family protein [Woeseiaceae bacterium]
QRLPDDQPEALAKASSNAVRMEIVPIRSVINLRGTAADESLITDVQRAVGMELPLMPNRWHGDDCMAAAWLGPDEWLLVARGGEAEEIEQAIRELRPADPWLSLVDVSHSYTCVRLAGSHSRDLIAAGCALDLDPSSFHAGHCAQTLLARAQVLLRALDGNDSFEIWVRNSFARYLIQWLLDATTRTAVEAHRRGHGFFFVQFPGRGYDETVN